MTSLPSKGTMEAARRLYDARPASKPEAWKIAEGYSPKASEEALEGVVELWQSMVATRGAPAPEAPQVTVAPIGR